MRKLSFARFAMVASIGLVGISSHGFAQGVNIHQATLTEAGAKTPEVSTDQLRRILSERSAIVLDTRSSAEFAAGHIPGAVNLAVKPGEQVAAVGQLVKGDKSAALVLYCNGPFCQASRRLAEQLAAAGYSKVSRYQLGIPVWRALGGPVAVAADGVKRIAAADRSAVFIDARSEAEFASGTVLNARSAPVDDVVSGKLKKMDLPEDDFNSRVVLIGRDGAQARKLADFMSKRPWHNVMYFDGGIAELRQMLSSN